MGVQTYSADRIGVYVNGVRIAGLADGDAVKFTPKSDRFSTTVGIDGTAVRSKLNDHSGTFEVVLQYTSDANAMLQGYELLDRAAGGSGVFAFAIIDLDNPLTLHVTDSAWVQAQPEAAFGRESPTRTWTIGSAKVRSNEAGHILT